MFSVAIAKKEKLLYEAGCTKLDWVSKTVRYGLGKHQALWRCFHNTQYTEGGTTTLAI